jgi:putative ABC transport system permease protein
MHSTYLLVALRVLRRNKAYSLLNILGLSIGVAASVLIFLVIRWETGYDGYHQNKDRIYRVVTSELNRSNGEVVSEHAYAPLGLGDVIGKEVPGIAQAAAFFRYIPLQVHTAVKGAPDGKVFLQSNLVSAEPALFSMIDVDWLEGNAGGLKDPGTVVIAAGVAKHWFGDWRHAVGKTIELGSGRSPLLITGVFRDLPGNTELPLEVIMSYQETRIGLAEDFTKPDRWHYPAIRSELFVMLDKKGDRARVEGSLAGIVDKYYNERQTSYTTRSLLGLEPVPAMHLDEQFDSFKGDALSKKVLWSLGTIGVLLLVVACINFINLSTAQSVKRSKEVGVRKVLGSDRGQLFRQFMIETAVITLIAIIIGGLMAQLALPWLREVMGKPVAADWFHSPTLLLFLLGAAVVVIGLAGFYPAVVLSGFNVVEAIKNRISAKTIGGLSMRRGLVVVQFAIAQLLIVGTLVVVRQMQFFRTRPMGFDQTAVALLKLPASIAYLPMQPSLKRSILEIPGVEAASLTNEGPTGGIFWHRQPFFYDRSRVPQDWQAEVQAADPDFVPAMRIPLVAGVLPDSDRNEVVVNETLVKRLGLRSPLEIIGKTIALINDTAYFRVTGVVRDYHRSSLREPIIPVVIKPEGGGYNYITLRIRPDRLRTTIAAVQQVFMSYYPEMLFDCQWLDERIAHFYEREEITSRLVKVFAALAILISCLGLYGLVAFLAIQKTKEVGIRKVLGASVGSIVLLFSKEFTVLTLLAFVIAAPLGYAVMQHWLDGFYYHVSLGWGVFALTLVASLAIAWITVGYKALLAALVNPASSLMGQ